MDKEQIFHEFMQIIKHYIMEKDHVPLICIANDQNGDICFISSSEIETKRQLADVMNKSFIRFRELMLSAEFEMSNNMFQEKEHHA